ncbi:MAG TPA: hypothetical protein VGL81_35125 [Polyangiaceae bacterium]|jgi:hypothetical protein|nr:hypothetical protein [Polyangiaceae bacterium]
MGPRRPRAVVLEAGAFIAFEKSDRKVRTLIELSMIHGAPLHTTGGVVAIIVTSDPEDLKRLEPSADVVVC